MKKWNLVVDVASCTNCNNCTLAVHDEYVGNDWPGYSAAMPKHGHHWIDIKRKERGAHPMLDVAYAPTMCQHCDDSPCLKASKNGAVKKRDDGIVIFDPEKSKGQRQLVDACPHGAVWWNEEKQIPQIWTFDAHLLDAGWKEPRCAQVCATSAFKTLKVTDEEMEGVVRSEGLEKLNPQPGSRPRVWYKNLYRYNKAFIGGSVSAVTGGVEDYLEGASVSLKKGATTVAETKTDTFGEFKFDGLTPGESFTVEIHAAGRQPAVLKAEVKESVYLGDVVLK